MSLLDIYMSNHRIILNESVELIYVQNKYNNSVGIYMRGVL